MPANRDKTVFFPFTLDIPWKVQNNSICQTISKDIWKRDIDKNPASIVCPGYLIEIVISVFAYHILNNNKINTNKWIIPSYYMKGMELFGVKAESIDNENNIFKEYERIIEANLSYPTPIFFDKKKRVYFNMFNNYGNLRSPSNYIIKRNEKPFWKQILDNLCVSNYEYMLSNKYFNYEKAKQIAYKFLNKFGINENDNYYIVDSTNLFSITADGREVENRIIFPVQIKNIVDALKLKKIKSIVLANDITIYHGIGVDKVIPSWNRLESDLVISLVSRAAGIISPDQNLYLLAAMLGVENIISIDEEIPGFRCEDVPETFKPDNRKWNIFNKDKSIYDLII